MTVEARIRSKITSSLEDVFLRRDFDGLGSPSQLSRALQRLLASGILVRLGLGVFARAKPSVLSGKPIPIRPLDVLAPLVLQRLGVTAGPGRLTAAYNAGQTSQLPAGLRVNTGGRRISRRLGFGGRFVEYEREPQRRASQLPLTNVCEK